MTTQNGRSGSLNPGGDASPYKLANAGGASPESGRGDGRNPGEGANPFKLASAAGAPVVVTRLKRIAESQPTAWEGITQEGHKVHIAYLFGTLSVEVRCAVSGKPGCSRWVPVAVFQPSLIEAEIGETGSRDPDRYPLRVLAERAMVAEIRRSTEADMSAAAAMRDPGEILDVLLNGGRLVIRDSQLRQWLEMRNRNLDNLGRKGLAGGSAAITVRFEGEGRHGK